jgi:uncharacterized damage-inducible protein DinB
MELLPVVRQAFEHHYWARNRQLRTCAGLTGEQFERPVGGSFPSLRETLAHMAAVEWIWLERWRGNSPRGLPGRDEFPTLAVLTGRWEATERDMREYLESLDEDVIARPKSYISTRGERWTYPLWQAILHLLNHQSYHRGQVTTQFRLLGAEPPRVDYLVGQDVGFTG